MPKIPVDPGTDPIIRSDFNPILSVFSNLPRKIHKIQRFFAPSSGMVGGKEEEEGAVGARRMLAPLADARAVLTT
jgi:hypothetical protein